MTYFYLPFLRLLSVDVKDESDAKTTGGIFAPSRSMHVMLILCLLTTIICIITSSVTGNVTKIPITSNGEQSRDSHESYIYVKNKLAKCVVAALFG